MADGQPTQSSDSKNNQALKIALIVVGVIVLLGILGFMAAGFLAYNVAKKSGVDVDNGSVTIKGEDGKTTFSAGEDVELPEGFPTDVPIYEPSNVTFAVKGEEDFNVTLSTPDEPKKVKEFYAKELAKNGWKTGEGTYEVSLEGGGFSRSYTKDNRTLNVSATGQDEEGNSAVSLTISQED